MSLRSAVFLRVFAGWTVFVWAVFIRNIAKDRTHSSGFKTVHIGLAVVSLAFAAGCFAVVSATRRGGEAADHAPEVASAVPEQPADR